mgnify:FL=1
MEAKELRLNNWVNFKFSDLNSNVIICHNDLRNFERNIKIGEFNNIYKPIPLTEEFALMLGANNTFYNNYLDFEYFEIYESNGIWYVEKEGVILCELKYVHQLQNLYFALTNKELTIK